MAKDSKKTETLVEEGRSSLCSLITRTLISLIAVLILFYQVNSLTSAPPKKVTDFYQDKPSTFNYDFPSRFIKTNGISLNVITMGREENFDENYSGERDPLIIYLHGFPQAAATCWTNQLQDFAKRNFKYGEKRFALMAPDLRGYNTSDKPDFNNVNNYDMGELVHDVKGLIEGYYKNGKGKAVLVSHDWGAIISWALASTYPEVVEKLIVLNVPHPVSMQREIAQLPLKAIIAQLKKSWYILFMQLGFSIPENYFKRDNYTPLALAYMDLAKKGILSMEDYHHYAKGWAQPNSLNAMMAYYKGFMTGKYSNAIKMKLGYPDARRYPKVGQTLEGPLEQQRVRVPTLIMWGKEDIALIEETADLSFKYYIDESVKPKSKIIKFEAGHFIALEIPNTVIQEIEQFVTQQ